jgi:hypothetical protein
MFGATMPEAAVKEHGDLRPREDEISPTTNLFLGSHIDAVSESGGMNESTHGHLGACIASSLSLHANPDGIAGRWRAIYDPLLLR